jgi:dTDP-4-dehydrorhamnose reductase
MTIEQTLRVNLSLRTSHSPYDLAKMPSLPAFQNLPDPPLPLLVTGVAGVAGYNAFHYFRRQYGERVIGLRRVDNWLLRGPGIVGCNIDDREGLWKLFEEHQFASVLSTEGTCALKSCEMDPPMAWRINVLGAMNLVEAVKAWQARLVHLSIDLVFSGEPGGDYEEAAVTDPVTVYGKTMVQSEAIVHHEKPDACVLRISLPMGISFNGHAGAIDWIQSRFKKSKPATLYYDEIRTPTYTDCLNSLFQRLLAGDLAGLFHAGGPRKLSLFQIAQIVNRAGGYDPRLLHGCLRRQAGPMPPRAGNVSLDSGRLQRALGYAPFTAWPLDERWVPTHREWHAERSELPAGSPALLASLLYQGAWSAFARELDEVGERAG